MTDPSKIRQIMDAVSIPVMAKCRIGHFAEAQILECLGVDFIDESEVLTPADPKNHISKRDFTVPFVCGCRNLREALRRISEGATMIRTKGNAGTGDISEAIKHVRLIKDEISSLQEMSDKELKDKALEFEVPYSLMDLTRQLGRLPVVTFGAGGIATPADASILMQLGLDGVFVGSVNYLEKILIRICRGSLRAKIPRKRPER